MGRSFGAGREGRLTRPHEGNHTQKHRSRLTVAGSGGVLAGIALLVVGGTTALACPTPSVATTLEPAGTQSATVATGTSVYDTVKLTASPQSDVDKAGGTIQYDVYTNDTCSAPAVLNLTPASPGNKVVDGVVPPSKHYTFTAPGTYYFQATYSGDTPYLAGNQSGCNERAGYEQLTVLGPTATTTAVWSNLAAVTGPLVAGAVVTDVAKVGPEFDQTPIGGSVSFTFFSNGSCNSPGTKAGTAPLIAGTAISLSEGPLGVGTYSFQATYNGDHDYAASIGGCEPFSVGPDIITKVYDAAGGTWTGDEVTGSSAYDTAVVSPRIGNINPTGSVTYTFFDNGTCASGEDSPGVVWTEKVSLSGGLVPNSKATAPLTAGSYSFSATYSGSLLYASSTGACEPFTLGKAATAVTTAVEDAAGGAAWRGSEATGSSAYDTATVGPEQDHTVITGTVTYQLFTNGSCAGSGDPAPISDTVTLNPDGSVPNSTPEGPLGAGPWSFLATYSGDSNYAAAVGGCEPLTVGTAATTVTSAVTDPANGGVWQDSELAGASAYDTAAVAPEQDDTPITGTVSYQFFGNGTCTGMSVSAGTVTMSDGTVPSPTRKVRWQRGTTPSSPPTRATPTTPARSAAVSR